MSTTKRIALVTGANRGLGLAWSKLLAHRGYLVMLSAREMDKAEAAAKEVRQWHPQSEVVPVVLDVTDEASIQRLAEWVGQEYGRLDLLINNAGINSKSSNNELTFLKNYRLGYLDAEVILEMMRINTIAPILVAKHFVDLLRRGREAKIINMSSWLGSISLKNNGGNYSYAASKAALNMMMRALAYDLVKEGVIVVAVNPGWVQTRMGGLSANITPEESVLRLMENVVDKINMNDTGKFFDWDGKEHPW